jgi:DNA gyrase subunit B
MGVGEIRVEAERDERHDGYRLVIIKTVHGNRYLTRLDQDFVDSGDYEQIKQTALVLQGLIQPGAYVERGEHKTSITSFKQGLDWLLSEVRRNLGIQRYKGLGEMNPGQLWETTMDPKTRRLLRVQIDDVITSDEIFTMLMGDEVEPRRAFIESNALGVRNLDV